MFRESLKTEEPAQIMYEQPELLISLDFIYDGFWELGRPSGMGVGFIPYSEKSIFLHDHGIDPDSSTGGFIRRMWGAMDPVYVEATGELSEKERKLKNKKSPPRRSAPTMGRK